MRLPLNYYFGDAEFEEKTSVDLDPYLFWLDGFEEATISHECYWEAAIDLINAWSAYQAKRKLYLNANDYETRHKVWHIVEKNYGGSMRRLESHRVELSGKVDLAIDRFSMVCRKVNVEPVNREWLFRSLKESKDYESIRKKCSRRMEAKKPPESLKNLIGG